MLKFIGLFGGFAAVCVIAAALFAADEKRKDDVRIEATGMLTST